MLAEISHVRQDEPGKRRRWFRDDYFDLFVWQSLEGEITGFQLCYDLPANERVLSWRRDVGYSHNRIDSGEENPYKNMTPIMVPDGVLPVDDVVAEFTVRAQSIERGVRDTIMTRLREYAAVDKPTPAG